jgi:hypothetical protein
MSRKYASSLPVLVQLVSRLPWWLSVVLAIGSGLYLHSVAVGPVPVNALHLDELLVASAFKGMARFGQFVVPALFIGGAVASFLARRKRRRLLDSITTPGGNTLVSISSQEFEASQSVASTEPQTRTVVDVPQPIAVPEPVAAPDLNVAPSPVPEKPIEPQAPACPHCKKVMIMKVARTGPNAGGNFWGCGDYPKCRGIRAIFAPMKIKS